MCSLDVFVPYQRILPGKQPRLYPLPVPLSPSGMIVAGQSHLMHPIENTLKLRVVPASCESPGMDADTRGCFLAQEMDTAVADGSQMFVGMTMPHLRAIFSQGHIEHPMQPALASPVALDRGGKGLHRRKTEQKDRGSQLIF